MVLRVRVADRGTLVGVSIGAIAGIAWSLWAASGLMALSAPAAVAVAIAGVVVGLLILVPTARARRAAQAVRSPSMFSSRRYWLVVVAEFAAIGVGAFVLARAGWSSYDPAWVAFVVGVHFLGFGNFFRAGFYLLGVALMGAAVVGAVVGIAGGGRDGVAVATGVLAAASLFASSARVFRPSPEHVGSGIRR